MYNLVKWAEFGDPQAQHQLARKLRREGGDENKIWSLMRKAADCGLPAAQYEYGMMFIKGEGMQNKFKTGIKWLTKAAFLGYVKAQYALFGIFSKNKDAISQEYAGYWLYLAASNGDHYAEYQMAQAYLYGKYSFKPLYSEAINYLKRSAESGHAKSLFLYGYCLMNGIGIRKNKQNGMRNIKNASKKGNTGARQFLKKGIHLQLGGKLGENGDVCNTVRHGFCSSSDRLKNIPHGIL